MITNKEGRGGYSPVWTEEETAYLRENYATLTAREISAVLGRSETALHVRANKLGLKSRHRTGINSLVPGYFKVIDTPVKAYLLGLMTADGFVSRDNQVCLALSGKDRVLVELLRDELAPGARIGGYLTREKRPMALFRVQSPDLAADLAAHGVVPAKTLITRWPKTLPADLESSYVCGYFDGDGCLMMTHWVRWSIVCGCTEFLTAMQDHIEAGTGIRPGGPYQDKRHNAAWSIVTTGKPVRVLDEWIHRDVPGLARKRMPPSDQDVLF